MGDAKFQDETVPVNVAHGVGDRKIVTRDEGPKPNTTDEKRAMLPTLFDKDGAATAGNCSSMDDCHSVLLIVQERKAEELGLTPLAPIMSYPVVGTDPNNMRISLYELLVGTLKHANLTLQDNCPIKLNEAFATEYLAVERELGLDRSLKSTLFGPVSVT